MRGCPPRNYPSETVLDRKSSTPLKDASTAGNTPWSARPCVHAYIQRCMGALSAILGLCDTAESRPIHGAREADVHLAFLPEARQKLLRRASLSVDGHDPVERKDLDHLVSLNPRGPLWGAAKELKPSNSNRDIYQMMDLGCCCRT